MHDIFKNNPIDRESLYEQNKVYYEKLYKERLELIELRPQILIPIKIRLKLEEAVTLQKWRTVKSDGDYASLPHQYVVRKYWNDKAISFDFFCEVMRQYCSIEIWKGNLKHWAGRKGEYLKIGNFKYWNMGYPIEITTVINRENPTYKTHGQYIIHNNEEI